MTAPQQGSSPVGKARAKGPTHLTTYLYEGLQINYLVLLRRVPGERASWDRPRRPVTWIVHCNLCGSQKQVQIREPPQWSCGCLRQARYRAIHQARLLAKASLELARAHLQQ